MYLYMCCIALQDYLLYLLILTILILAQFYNYVILLLDIIQIYKLYLVKHVVLNKLNKWECDHRASPRRSAGRAMIPRRK